MSRGKRGAVRGSLMHAHNRLDIRNRLLGCWHLSLTSDHLSIHCLEGRGVIAGSPGTEGIQSLNKRRRLPRRAEYEKARAGE